jgi:conjugative transfer signal peptidase TraF
MKVSRRTIMCATVLAACMLFPSARRPLVVFNASASVPIGFYAVLPPGPLRPGDFVLVQPPRSARELADERGYLPATVPLVKPVAALPGTCVCARGAAILIEGRSVATRRSRDGQGRPLPQWQGCRRLAADELFLMAAPAADSFDSRYFGPVPRGSVIGRLSPLWLR